MNINPTDSSYLDALSALHSKNANPFNKDNLDITAHRLNHALNICIKYIDKKSLQKSSISIPVCSKCQTQNVFKHRKSKELLYCPNCSSVISDPESSACPDCHSTNSLVLVATTKRRFKCKKCGATNTEGVGLPTAFNKFIHFSHLIYNTTYSYNQIVNELKISSDTYYRWKKRLAIYFPNTIDYLYEKRGKK
jgi:predicted RNA-binding Zn-ribbon protein involved in translation (DUF1610 family)